MTSLPPHDLTLKKKKNQPNILRLGLHREFQYTYTTGHSGCYSLLQWPR